MTSSSWKYSAIAPPWPSGTGEARGDTLAATPASSEAWRGRTWGSIKVQGLLHSLLDSHHNVFCPCFTPYRHFWSSYLISLVRRHKKGTQTLTVSVPSSQKQTSNLGQKVHHQKCSKIHFTELTDFRNLGRGGQQPRTPAKPGTLSPIWFWFAPAVQIISRSLLRKSQRGRKGFQRRGKKRVKLMLRLTCKGVSAPTRVATASRGMSAANTLTLCSMQTGGKGCSSYSQWNEVWCCCVWVFLAPSVCVFRLAMNLPSFTVQCPPRSDFWLKLRWKEVILCSNFNMHELIVIPLVLSHLLLH